MILTCWQYATSSSPSHLIPANTTAQVETIRASEFEKAVHKLGDGVNKKQLRAVEDLSKVRVCH